MELPYACLAYGLDALTRHSPAAHARTCICGKGIRAIWNRQVPPVGLISAQDWLFSAHMNAHLVEEREPAAPTAAALRAHSGRTLMFEYAPAADASSNLLILLHGLGDSRTPFLALGHSLQRTLPQTAMLSVQAPLRVPLLEEDAWMWWESFDSLGERACLGVWLTQRSRIRTRGGPSRICARS